VVLVDVRSNVEDNPFALLESHGFYLDPVCVVRPSSTTAAAPAMPACRTQRDCQHPTTGTSSAVMWGADTKGKPGCLRESVERLPMRPKYTKVRARSENEGSGIMGWSCAAPVAACFLMDGEDIPVLFCQSNLSLCLGRSVCLRVCQGRPGQLNKGTARRAL
jgi:hypothetical protein